MAIVTTNARVSNVGQNIPGQNINVYREQKKPTAFLTLLVPRVRNSAVNKN